jgi:adenylate cyclase
MSLTPGIKHKLRTVLIVTIAGVIIGVLFANLAFGFTFYRVIKGALIGFLISSLSSGVEMFLFPKLLKRLSFITELFLRSVFYLTVISFSTLFVVVVHESIEDNMSFSDALYGRDVSQFLQTDFIYIFAFAIFGSLLMNFVWQISRVLGKGVLINTILGRYIRPVSEERIFMFLDIKSATTLGEKLGAKTYSSFLQDLFYDITDPVLETSGSVYQYAGDEVVLTWKAEIGIVNYNCISCFFKIKEKISERKEFYLNKYGVEPSFKAGLHIGEAIVTEVGDLKKEIVFHGDVLNTASRIQAQCNQLNQQLLVSDILLKKFTAQNDYHFQFNGGMRTVSMGRFKLRGKEEDIELFGVTEINLSGSLN